MALAQTNFGHEALRGPASRRGVRLDPRLLERAVRGWWTLFLIVASSAIPAFIVPGADRYGWLVGYVVVLIAFARHPARLLELAAANRIFIAWAAIATLSAMWSEQSARSFYHGFQLFMTVATALAVVMHLNRTAFLEVLFLAIVAGELLSIMAYALNPVATIGWQGAWQGSYGHKNTLGIVMMIGILTGLCLYLSGKRDPITIAGMLGALALLGLSRAGTSLILMAISVGLVALLLCAAGGPRSRAMTGAMVAFLLAMLLVTAATIDLAELVLSSVGKDATLTGRTLLWEHGTEAFLSRPLLGFGFKGYWEGVGTGAVLLQQAIGHDLWHFHNTFMETAVAFGITGPILLAAGLATVMRRGWTDYLRTGDPGALWCLLVGIILTLLCFVEQPVFENHAFLQVLMIVAAAAQPAGRHKPTLEQR